MEMLNRAIDGASLFKDMMQKVKAGAAPAAPVDPGVAAWNAVVDRRKAKKLARKSQSARLSVRMQDIAAKLNELLAEAAGDEIGWVLVCQVDGVAQYVSNASLKDGTELIESLLARWNAGHADIPAHYNPDLSRRA